MPPSNSSVHPPKRYGASGRPLAGRSVAVFGSSEPQPGTADYERARRLGARLAEAGARIVTGGYGGVMEAASRGAREVGGEALGVVGSFFPERSPNRFLTEVVASRDLFERTRLLIDSADAFIILPGKSGTLAEVAFLWALDRARLLGPRPVILCGAVWSEFLEQVSRAGLLEDEQRRMTRVCHAPEEAVELLVLAQARGGEQEES